MIGRIRERVYPLGDVCCNEQEGVRVNDSVRMARARFAAVSVT